MSDNRAKWADLATRGILSKTERKNARQELLDHMEDHAQALLAAGFSPEAAQAQALQAMGDPAEVAKLLRKAHQPILTRFLQVCRVAAIFLAVVVLWNICVSPQALRWSYFAKPTSPSAYHTVTRREVPLNQTVRLGDYTLEMTSATVLYGNTVHTAIVFLEISPDRFWQDAPVLQGTCELWADGRPCPTPPDQEPQFYAEVSTRRLNTFYGELMFAALREPQQLTLHFTGGENTSEEGLSITLDLTGGTIYEAAE